MNRNYRFLTVAWGNYADQMCDFLIPSMLAPNNLPKLHEYFVIEWWIYTDEAGANKISTSPGFLSLSEIVRVIFRSTEVTNYINDKQESRRQNKYDFCNSLYTNCFKDGVISGVIISWLQPDVIVSHNTFSSVCNSILNGYKVVWAPPGFRTNLADMMPFIQHSQSTNGTLTVIAEDAVSFTLSKLSNWEKRRNIDRYDQDYAVVNLYSMNNSYCIQFSYPAQPLAIDLSCISRPELVDYYEGTSIESSSFFSNFSEDEQDILLNSAQALVLFLEHDNFFSKSSFSRAESSLKPASRLRTAFLPFSHKGFVVNNYLMFRIWVYRGAVTDGSFNTDSSFAKDYKKMLIFRNYVQFYFYFLSYLLILPRTVVLCRSFYSRLVILLLRFAFIRYLNKLRKLLTR